MGVGEVQTSMYKRSGNSLAVQWSCLCTLIDKGLSSIPGQGTKISQAMQHGQKEKKKKKRKATRIYYIAQGI